MENEYGLFGSDHHYLATLRDLFYHAIDTARNNITSSCSSSCSSSPFSSTSTSSVSSFSSVSPPPVLLYSTDPPSRLEHSQVGEEVGCVYMCRCPYMTVGMCACVLCVRMRMHMHMHMRVQFNFFYTNKVLLHLSVSFSFFSSFLVRHFLAPHLFNSFLLIFTFRFGFLLSFFFGVPHQLQLRQRMVKNCIFFLVYCKKQRVAQWSSNSFT